MKRQTRNRQLPLAINFVLALSALRLLAANGTWINPAGGSWSDPANWLNSIVANGPGSTADFSTIDVPAGTTITVTADVDPINFLPFTVGNMLFGDTDSTNGVGSWIIAEGGGGLTLEGTTSSNSTIRVELAQGTVSNLNVGWGTVTITATLNGTNTLVKTGPNHLILNPTASANNYTGGTIISNGLIYLSANSEGTMGTGPVAFYGGALRLQNAAAPGDNPSVNATPRTSFTNDIIVPTGQRGLIYMPPRPTALPANRGTVSGGGTLTMIVDYVRGNIGGDWTGFTGRLYVASSTRQATSDLRFDATFVPSSWANNALVFTNNGVTSSTVFMYNPGLPVGTVVEFGELAASSPGLVTVQATGGVNNGAGGSAPFVMQVGALNTDASFSGNINANVGLIKVGTGTWTLNGPSVEYTGVTVVSNGVLRIGQGTSGKLGRTAIVTNYATLAFGRSDSLVVTNVIDGPGTVEQRGDGTLILAPAGGLNTYSGKTMVTSGLLLAVTEAALGPNPPALVADQLTLNGGGLRTTNNQTIGDSNRGITLGSAGGTLSPDTNTSLTLNTVIAGVGSLTVDGEGTASLTAANTYSGKTILKAGVLSIGSENALGANPGSLTPDQLTFDGGVLVPVVNASMTISAANRGVKVADGGGELRLGAGTTLTLATPLAGSGVLAKTGAGTLVLNASGSYSGTIAVNVGTLAIGAGGALPGTATVNVASGATLDISAAGLSLTSGQTVGGNGAVVGNLSAGAGAMLSAGASIGALTVTGNLTMNGATNTVEISSSTNDVMVVSGNLTLNGVSTINLVPLSTLPAGTYTLIKYGGTLTGGLPNLALAGYPSSRLAGSLVVNAANKSIDLVISGAAGTLVWTGGQAGNAWDVNTTANWLNNSAPDKFFDGDSVSFTAIGSTNPTVNLVAAVTASATVNSSTDYTFSGPGKLTGLSALTKSGTGKLTVLTTNDYSGTTTISGGTIQVGNGAASGSLGSGTITDNGSLIYNLPGSLTEAAAIGGSGSLTVQTGSLILTGTNAYGATVINNGATLRIGDGGSTGSLGAGSVTDNGALVFNRSGATTNSGAIGGSGSLSVLDGIVVLAANNNYAGATTVDSGTLQVGAGGTSGTLGTAGSVTLTNGGTLEFNRSDNLTNLVAIIGTNGTLAKAGTGTLVINNDNNDYGTTVVSAGRLQLGDGANPAGRIGAGSVIVTNVGTLVFNRPDEFLFTNRITGNGSVAHIGPTNLFIGTPGGANTYSGGTTISNTTIVMTNLLGNEVGAQTVNSGALGTGTLTFLGNSTLQLNTANQQDPFGNGSGNVANPINVPSGQTGTILFPGRFTLSSAVSGSGTLNLAVNYVRGDVTANWTNFTGILNVTTNPITPATAYDFRMASALGFPNARVNLVGAATMYSRAAANQRIPIGALSGEAASSLRSTSGGGTSAGANENWVVGGLNTDAVFDGTLLDGNSFTKVGTGKWTLTGANTFTGSLTVSNGVVALATSAFGADGTISGSGLINIASPGLLDVTGLTDGTLHLGDFNIQTNGGNGTVRGKIFVGPSGVLSPGFPLGTMTVSSNVTIQGTLLLQVNTTNTPSSDLLVAPAIAVDDSLGTATLTVENLGDEPAAWTKFKMTSVPVSGAFVITNLPFPSNPDLYWSNRLSVDGTLVVASLTIPPPTVNTTPTNIVFQKTGNTLEISWPADHTGWQLRVQTNSASQGVSTNLADWAVVPNSTTTNRVIVTIDAAKPTEFYRLFYQP